MTFTEIQTEILSRLNLTSTAASTRVGNAINRRYREITSSLGLAVSRRSVVNVSMTIASANVLFPTMEKIETVFIIVDDKTHRLEEITFGEMVVAPEIGTPTKWCVTTVSGVTGTMITLNHLGTATTPAIYAEGSAYVATLSGSNVPNFPESFHDVLVEAVLIDEYRKLEKVDLSRESRLMYESRLSDLRMWIAKAAYLDIYQGKTSKCGHAIGCGCGCSSGGDSGGGSGLSSSETTPGSPSYTQTGLITFDRDPSAPFAVTSGSAKVTNLDADKLDGHDSSDFVLIGGAIDADTLDGHDSTYFLNGSSSVDADLLDGQDSTYYLNTGSSVDAALLNGHPGSFYLAPSTLPSGLMAPFGGDTPPSGWLLCDGTAVSRATYADLFTAIGTLWGVGNGSTTFNLPDCRQKAVYGQAASGTGSTYAGTFGSIDHTHTVSVSAHTHTISSDGAHTHTGPSHTHTGPAHTHTGPLHTHTGPSHVHSGPSHTHSIAGESDHAHSVDGDSVTNDLNYHTHNWGQNSGTPDYSILMGVDAPGSVNFYNVTDSGHIHYVAGVTGTPNEDTTHVHAIHLTTGGAGAHSHTGATGAAGAGDTGASGTGATSADGNGATSSDGTGATGASGTGATSSDGAHTHTGATGSATPSGSAAASNPPGVVAIYIIKT